MEQFLFQDAYLILNKNYDFLFIFNIIILIQTVLYDIVMSPILNSGLCLLVVLILVHVHKKLMLTGLVFLVTTLAGLAQDTIHLRTYFRDLKTVDVFIKGKKYDFLFDAGGGETYISPDIAKLMNKKIYGSSTGFRMDGEMIKYQKSDSISFRISSTEVFHKTAGVWDIMSILPKELPKLDGVISLKSFSNSILTIDLSKNILIIENKASSKEQFKTKSLLPSRFTNGLHGDELTILIGVPKYRSSYWFLFDTGNIGPVILSTESAVLWGLQSETSDSAIVETNAEFVIGKNILKENSYSKKIIYDGVLNFEAISKYIFTIDFKKKEVWIN